MKRLAPAAVTATELRELRREIERRMQTQRRVGKSGHGPSAPMLSDIGKRFGLTPEDLNLDLGPLGKLM